MTGTGGVSVPLPLSPSRSGFGPKLNLSYDSGAGNGPFGVGWALDLPAITRKTDKGLPRYCDREESDVFLLAGAEDLVPVLDAQGERVRTNRTLHGLAYEVRSYRPRIEGLFIRIEYWIEVATGVGHWRCIGRDNVTTLYGIDGNSRIASADAPNRTASYLASRSFDDKGNVAHFIYAPEDGQGVDTAQAHETNRTYLDRSAQRYLKRIRYGNAEPWFADWSADGDAPALPTDWRFEVVFDYGDHRPLAPGPSDGLAWRVRPDPFSNYRFGFEVRTYRRCRRILMFHHFANEADLGTACLVRSLELEYSDERVPPEADEPAFSTLVAMTQRGYRRTGSVYRDRALPPLEFEYSRAAIEAEVRTIEGEDLAALPQGVDGRTVQWVDLEGDGLGGALSVDPGGGWSFRPNLSPLNLNFQPDGSPPARARLGPARTVEATPSRTDVAAQQFLDLDGDGVLELVAFGGPNPGYFEAGPDGEGWRGFRTFKSLPAIDWNAPNLKFVDLTGDGLADVLLTHDDGFLISQSRGADGFGPVERHALGWNEERGPKLISGDDSQAIFLADMSGDGLSDLVRVRSREICYWPNLGYGAFGAKVTMDETPRFTDDPAFDPARVRLADIDGSGCTDMLYVGKDGVWVSFNRSGGTWAAPRRIAVFPSADGPDAVQVFDLLGNGTACLVWSSPSPGIAGPALRYVDLIGGRKPHLLTRLRNNLGGETRLRYAPSTHFYLADQHAGRPWITRAPFPVHVVERVETYDFIGRSRFISRYAYHHGHFDGYEREFRGFGMVEQWDTQEHRDDTAFAEPTANWDRSSWSPPVHTKTWFHTGAFLPAAAVSRQYASEYWVEPALRGETNAADRAAMELPDTVLPPNLTPAEVREACRALKGMTLRVEVYGDDGGLRAAHPYSIAETNFTVERLQARDFNRHGVFFVHPRENLSFVYERRATDPRVAHDLVLEVNAFGDILRSVSVAYPRRSGAAPGAPDAFAGMLAYDQSRLHIGATEHRHTNAIGGPLHPDAWRAPLQCETIVAELTGVAPAANRTGVTNLFGFAELDAHWATLWDGTHDIAYEDVPASDIDGVGAPSAVPARRIVDRARTLYRHDDLSGLLALGKLEPLALPGETYKLALTAQLVARVFGARVSDAEIQAGGYVRFTPAADWWIPSGRVFYSPGDTDTAAVERLQAKAHFYAPRRAVDPFGAVSRVRYDAHDLLAVEASDALGNVSACVNDYRVLSPREVVDPNGNRAAFAFDALGLMVGTAVMGKAGEGLGDSLADFEPDLDEATILAHLAAPLIDPHTVLADATSRIIYDRWAYFRSREDPAPSPSAVYTLARETHVADLAAGELAPIRHAFAYSDGCGHEIQSKGEAAPDPLAPDGSEVAPRWVGSGWSILDNKGNPVRRYEPFFSATHRFEFARTEGVSSILFHDAAGRLIATLHPDQSWEKTCFDVWRQEIWDRNDTVLLDPTIDPDVGDFFRRFLDGAAFTSWRARRIGGTWGGTPAQRLAEKSAAQKASAHAGTFSVCHLDSRGRVCLTVADAGGGQSLGSRVALDVEDKPLAMFDAEGRRAEEYCLREPATGGGFRYVAGYDLTGAPLYRNNMDAGARWSLCDAGGRPLLGWDARGARVRNSYDLLGRPTHVYVRQDGGAEILTDRLIYGEGMAGRNLCGRLFRHYDSAGLASSERFDFKGNPLETTRQFSKAYRTDPDWSALATLTAPGDLDTASASQLAAGERYVTTVVYDALDRPLQSVAPHRSGMRPSVFRFGYDEAGQAAWVHAWVREAAAPTALLDRATGGQPILTAATYNARGQNLSALLGNGTQTVSSYDPETLRLAGLTTVRPNADVARKTVQDLAYAYDPAGNITSIRDSADISNVVYFRNRRVDPSNDYVYDPLYRLISASGREHVGQGGAVQAANDDGPHIALPHPGDGAAMRRYVETYAYDAVGNILSMAHQVDSGGWTRRYRYAETSHIAAVEGCNRLSATSLPGDGPVAHSAVYGHDAHGCMIRMPHLPQMSWDANDQLRSTSRQIVTSGVPETTFYVYDGGGERRRKTTDRARAGPANDPGARRSERLYLGMLEIYREFAADGVTVTLERETLQASEALIETRTVGRDRAAAQVVRFQFGNQLGSSVLELDAGADVISYEEYFPYGGSSYQAVRSQQETPKRYRYTGKERDTENDLCYHGARYYAPWLGRWVSSDPAGMVDGPCLFQYGHNNPVMHRDTSGLSADDPPFSEIVGDAINKYGKNGYNLDIYTYSDNEGECGVISIVGHGMTQQLFYTNGSWSFTTTFAPTLELRGGPVNGSGLPANFRPSDEVAPEAGAPETETSALETAVEIGTDLAPFLGSGKDLYRGIRDGDWLQIGLGVGGLALDIVSFGGASIIKGGVKTVIKAGAKELAEEGVEAVAKKGAKEVVKKSSVSDGAKAFLESNRMLHVQAQRIQEEFMTYPGLMKSYLTPKEIASVIKKPGTAHLKWGRATELRLKEWAEGTGQFQHLRAGRGRPSPDFKGLGKFERFHYDLTSTGSKNYFSKMKYEKMGLFIGVPQYTRPTNFLIQFY